jgi:glucosamine--fructose-6-phosphate aminotransferase (isomerizing)
VSSRLAAEIAEQPAVLGSVLTQAALAEACALVASCSRVLLVGIGSSRHVAGYGTACFEALTSLPASLLPAPGAGVAQPALGPGDLLVVVSQSGRTPALLPLVERARSAGAAVVAVTNAMASPLEELADVTLHAAAGEERVVPATKSVTASMLLLRALASEVTTAELESMLDLVAQAVRLRAPQAPVPEVVVASGFAAEHVADEVALKLAEVAGRLAVAETVVDYLHGPAAVPAQVLALLDSADPNTVPGAYTVDDLGSTGSPSLDAIVRLVAGQSLVLGWALDLGVDPDDPRGLSKVTISL